MFALAYQKDRVTGTAMVRRQTPPAERVVDEAVPPDTVDQRIDWAAVMAIPLVEAGTTLSFRVYDPETAESRISVEVGRASARLFPPARSRRRASSTASIRVAVPHPATQNTRGRERVPLRFLVHETFPNGSTTELAAISR
jgi:hypothetical protein